MNTCIIDKYLSQKILMTGVYYKNNHPGGISAVSPGSIKGTSFVGGNTDLDVTAPLANEIIHHLFNKDDLFIPLYEEVFKDVLDRYNKDFRAEGNHSYEYKIISGRANK